MILTKDTKKSEKDKKVKELDIRKVTFSCECFDARTLKHGCRFTHSLKKRIKKG